MEAIVLRKREGDDGFTSVVISKNEVGITITTTKPKKRPKTDVEGFGALKVPEEERIGEIVGSYLAQGYFSEMPEMAQEPLDFYSAQFLDHDLIDAFCIDVQQSGLQMKITNARLSLEFDGFVATVKNTVKGVQITACVPQRLRHLVVPVFLAMAARAFEVNAADSDANSFELKEAFRLEHRSGQVSAEAISLLCNLGMIPKPLPPPAPKAGRVAFGMSL